MKNTVIMVTNNGTGKADEQLQLTLFGKYIELIQQDGDLPAAFCFYTDGVKMGDFIEAQMKAEKAITI